MDTKLEDRIEELKASIDVLILLELCKLGANREDVREALGKLDNNLFAKINRIVNQRNKNKNDIKTKRH
ncbi:MAG TPA: hypothetical protein VN862_00905 [Candidatus Acidoferrales bacterium]|nr:hypothetical protein [Candidatus Acidoferrales bacterium]